MSFQALFSDAQCLIIQLGLLGHVPHLGDYYRPENQQRDRRRDGLLPEYAYASVYRGPVCYRLYLYVKGGLHSYDGLEGASPADADLHPSRGDVRYGHLVVLLLEVIHHLLSNGSEIPYDVGNGLGRVESPHQVPPFMHVSGRALCLYCWRYLLCGLGYYGSGEEACRRSACKAFSTAISPNASVAKALASGESASSSRRRSVTTLSVCSRSSVSVIFPSSTILL